MDHLHKDASGQIYKFYTLWDEVGVQFRASIASLMLKRLFLRYAHSSIIKRPTPPNSNRYSTHNTQEKDEPFDADLAAEQDLQNLRKQRKTEWKRRQRVRITYFVKSGLRTTDYAQGQSFLDNLIVHVKAGIYSPFLSHILTTKQNTQVTEETAVYPSTAKNSKK